MSISHPSPKKRRTDWTLVSILAFSAFFGVMMAIGLLHTTDYLAIHIKALMGAKEAG